MAANAKKEKKTKLEADDYEVWLKSRQLLVPDDQLELTEVDLSEEITKVLTQTNTNVIHNLIVFSHKHGEFIQIPPAGDTVELFSMEGNALHIDSEEATWQIQESGEMGYPLPPPKLDLDMERPSGRRSSKRDSDMRSLCSYGGDDIDDNDGDGEAAHKDAASQVEEEAVGEEEEAEAGAEEEEVEEIDDDEEEEEEGDGLKETSDGYGGGKKRKLINLFNFCERAALTHVFPSREMSTQTVQPPRSTYSANVLQWNIFDSYAEDYAGQQLGKHKMVEKRMSLKYGAAKPPQIKFKSNETTILDLQYKRAWLIIDRMINQNIYNEIASDYRYWDDPADEYRNSEGTLLPLWKFMYKPTLKMDITDMLFNSNYYDLMAVSYGSNSFQCQTDGALCLFTIKNPSHPEYRIRTEIGIMCLDVHQEHPYLIVVGLHNGSVAVYNLTKSNYEEPLYVSSTLQTKHENCVWEVKWGPDLVGGEVNFYTASSDGTIAHWVLLQHDMLMTNIMTLYNRDEFGDGPDHAKMRLKYNPSCFQIHPVQKNIYLVGTEDGLIHKCDLECSLSYLMTYYAHDLAIYRIDFNRFNSNIFISCSGDWRVKIWEDMRPDPIFIFDLGSAVGDVRWAPFSSTVFGAVCYDGKVRIFDINVSKYRPLCVQGVVKKLKHKLTRLSFNDQLPFIIVGDDNGIITSLKLSPNLRIMMKPPKKQLYLDQTTMQIQKLDNILNASREPLQVEGNTGPDN